MAGLLFRGFILVGYRLNEVARISWAGLMASGIVGAGLWTGGCSRIFILGFCTLIKSII
jgi:hypothetical protein